MNSLIKLPEDLQLLIIEYLPPSDYSSLQLVNQELYQLFQRKPSLWAKQLFSCIIQSPNKSLNLFKFEIGEKKMYIPKQIEFNQFIEAKELWKCGAINKNRFLKFLIDLSQDSSSAMTFVDRIIKILVDPSLPEPVLKKDIYFFPTQSKFQNFLTELFYEIVPALKNDSDQMYLSSLCKKIKDLNQKSDALIYLRWYNSSENQLNNDVLSNFLIDFSELIKSHCNAIQGYISHIEDEKIQMKEYNRCWKEYTYSVIEIDNLLKPLSTLVNDIYSEQYPNHPQFPQFSFWRLMVKLWYQQVYSRLADKLKASYKKLFLSALIEKLNQSDLLPAKLYEINMELENFDNSSRFDEEDQYLIEKDIKIVRKHLIALEDLSLNEFTVFYHDCELNDEESPKSQIVKFIAEELKEFAIALYKVVSDDNNNFKIAFNNIQDTFSALLDERSIYEIMVSIYNSFQETINKSGKIKSQMNDAINKLGYNLKKQENLFHDVSCQRENQGYYKIEQGFQAFFNIHNKIQPDNLTIFGNA